MFILVFVCTISAIYCFSLIYLKQKPLALQNFTSLFRFCSQATLLIFLLPSLSHKIVSTWTCSLLRTLLSFYSWSEQLMVEKVCYEVCTICIADLCDEIYWRADSVLYFVKLSVSERLLFVWCIVFVWLLTTNKSSLYFIFDMKHLWFLNLNGTNCNIIISLVTCQK